MIANMSSVLHASNSKQKSTSGKFNLEMVNNENSQKKTVNRRSAVERLEETKANYVKTESVLDCKQNFEHSSNLHVSTGPQLDVLLKRRIKSIYDCPNIINYVQKIDLTDNKNVLPFQNDFVQKSCSTFESRRKSPDVTENSVLHRMKQFQQDCCDLAGADVVNVDSVQVQLRPFNTERRTFPHLPKHGTHLNENVHSSQMTFNAQQLDTEKDGNYSHMRKRTEEKSEHSDIEQNSFVPSEDSFSVGDDAIEREDKKQSSKTSDYVSRSSSFKCSVSSDRIKNLVKSFEARINSSNPSPVINFPATDEKKKTVSRSKSDVSCRFSKTISVAPESNNSSDSELERFFNMMGLDNNMWQNLTAPPESPVHFFDSISSLNSEDRLSSSGSEDSALVVQQTEGLKNSDLQRHAPTDTSIVEKNARVVKWLYNCHNALRKNTS